jgi:hypothetical protein
MSDSSRVSSGNSSPLMIKAISLDIASSVSRHFYFFRSILSGSDHDTTVSLVAVALVDRWDVETSKATFTSSELVSG